LDEFEEDAAGRSRVEEGDEPSMGPGSRFGVDQLEALLSEAAHLLANVADGEGQVMEAFAATLDEPGDHALRRKGLEEFNPDRAGPEEGDPHALRRDVLGRLGLESELAVVG